MNINNGKTGNVNIPGPLHSTGGDGDGQVGGVVAYAGDVYDETLGKNQKEINQTLLDGSGDSNVIAVALNDLNEKVEEQEKVTSSGLNDLNDKTDNLNEKVDDNEKTTASALTDLDEKTDVNEKAVSAALNDLSDKIDNVGGATSYEDLTDKPTILNNYDVASIAKENSLLQYDNSNNYVFTINYGYSAQSINTIENSESSIILGKYNHLSNANRGVMLGLNNNAIGDKSDSYDYTITIGYQNNNNNNQTVVIGAYLYNTKQYSTVIGTNNTNNSTNGINIGRFNYNSSVVDNNISIGYNNTIYKDIDGIVIGNQNTIARSNSVQNGQKTIAIGKGLYTDTDNITLGFYNAYYNGGDLMPKFAVSNGTDSSNRSNILEQYDNGDLFIKGLGGFTGNNSQHNRNTPVECKTVQQIITDLTNRIIALETQLSNS